MSQPTESKKKPGPLPPPAAQAVMYVGPALVSPLPIATGAVFASGLPRLLKEAADQDANLAALFLPLDQAGAALRSIEKGAGNLIKQVRAVAMAQARGGKQ